MERSEVPPAGDGQVNVQEQTEEGGGEGSQTIQSVQCSPNKKGLTSGAWKHFRREQIDGKWKAICKYCKGLFGYPISTVASESAFSIAGRTLHPHRSLLDQDIVEVNQRKKFQLFGILVLVWHECCPTAVRSALFSLLQPPSPCSLSARRLFASQLGGNWEMLKELMGNVFEILCHRDSQGCTVLQSVVGRGQVEVT
ncbi:hypothetical protein PIB30_064222 [Stylosanthes scabra]|uniref:HAT C-terminal dimerisation domain-containing protein n=1 Tax=Stylosanthes scabra TaxID=79078 RepID=A0ABU6ZKB6_9FABA|nr:hypothetical protein [Stylosanthes scabra]